METATQDERSKQVQITLDRSRELLAQADKLRQLHDQLRVQFPQEFQPGGALIWLQDNAGADPKAAQALEEYEAWSRSRPTPNFTERNSPKPAGSAHGRRNWQAI